MSKAVIFDMDGLMFDTEFLVKEGWDIMGEKLGYGKLGYMINRTLGVNAKKSKEVFFEEFGHKVNFDELTEHTREYAYKYYDENGVPVKKGLYELLKYLKDKNYKLAVASSSRRESVIHHIEDAKVSEYFDAIVCGDMIENSKPNPEIYLRAARELNVEPKNCIALEDAPNGIKAASKAGMKVIMIPDMIEATDEIKEMVTVELEHLGEVIDYLESFN